MRVPSLRPISCDLCLRQFVAAVGLRADGRGLASGKNNFNFELLLLKFGYFIVSKGTSIVASRVNKKFKEN